MDTAVESHNTALTAQLAERIHAFKWAHITPKALSATKTALIDTIGVMLAGIPEPCVQILLNTPGVGDAPGEASVFGTTRKTSALDAALINGTASHALDYDDFSQPMGGHHSVPLVAPLLAVAQERKLPGRAIIAAYVVGIETEIRVARAVNFHHYDKGWHPTATVGIFGTVAAISHLVQLDAGKTATALAIAASLAGGIKANFGTMVKPLHVGQTCRNGLLAVLLAERGYSANQMAFEHKQGFFNAFNGPGTFDASKVLTDWSSPLEIESRDMGLKQFPCCGSTHPAIAMALALVHEEKVVADDIVDIHIQAHRRRLPHTDNPHPRTALEAKFSIQYGVARALADGAVRLADFEGEAYRDGKVARLLSITRTDAHPDMPEASPKQFGAEVTLTMRDGHVLTRRVDDMVGRGIDNPMTNDELWEKFEDCSMRVLAASDIMSLFERLESFDTIEDFSQIARLMTQRALPGSPSNAKWGAQGGFRPDASAVPAKSPEMDVPTAGNTLAETSWVP